MNRFGCFLQTYSFRCFSDQKGCNNLADTGNFEQLGIANQATMPKPKVAIDCR
jgi:hypothetical protein